MSERFPLRKEFLYFVKERWSIHIKRKTGQPPPWTNDEILRTYRFCNVRREDDRVTRWIHDEWLNPHKNDYDTIIFAMGLARIVNLPSMLELIGYPERWNPDRFERIMIDRKDHGFRTFNSAYMINAVGAVKGGYKATYLARCVLAPLWKDRKHLGELLRRSVTLDELHKAIMRNHGFGAGFMAAQVIADVKWTPAGKKASDWDTFASWGPGSRRGLNRVCGLDARKPWKLEEWKTQLMELRHVVLPKLPLELRNLDNQNLQNCLCEFSKYMKAKTNEGRPKQYFKPSEQEYL